MNHFLQSVEPAPELIGARIAIAIILLAGISEGLGTQAAVLFVNQLSRRNFYLNLLLAGLVFALGSVAWIVSLRLIAAVFLGAAPSLWLVLRVVAMGYIPLLFAFLGLAPFAGPGILYLLHAWSFMAVMLTVERVFLLPLWQAFACTFGGWVLVQLLRRVTSRPTAIVTRWLWTKTTGTSRRLDFDDVPLVLPVHTGAGVAAAKPEQSVTTGAKAP